MEPRFINSLVAFIVAFLISLVVLIIMIAAMWKVYKKAGRSGWESLIPIYSTWVLVKIARKPSWWFALLIGVGIVMTALAILKIDQSTFGRLVALLLYLVNFILSFAILDGLAKAFGKGIGFTIGLFILQPIFIMILGFGKSQYLPIAPVSVPPVNPPTAPINPPTQAV